MRASTATSATRSGRRCCTNTGRPGRYPAGWGAARGGTPAARASTAPRYRLSSSPRHDEVADRDLNGRVLLVERGGADLDDADVGARLLLAHFPHFHFHPEVFARPPRARP